jgi:hypothetical protein
MRSFAGCSGGECHCGRADRASEHVRIAMRNSCSPRGFLPPACPEIASVDEVTTGKRACERANRLGCLTPHIWLCTTINSESQTALSLWQTTATGERSHRATARPRERRGAESAAAARKTPADGPFSALGRSSSQSGRMRGLRVRLPQILLNCRHLFRTLSFVREVQRQTG